MRPSLKYIYHGFVKTINTIIKVRVPLRPAPWTQEGFQAERGRGEDPQPEEVQQDHQEVHGEAEGGQG